MIKITDVLRNMLRNHTEVKESSVPQQSLLGITTFLVIQLIRRVVNRVIIEEVQYTHVLIYYTKL